MADDYSWKTSASRQSVVNRLNEAMQQSTCTFNKTALEMENDFFQKACNKDMYFRIVNGILLRLRQSARVEPRIVPPVINQQMSVDNSWKNPKVRDVMIKQLNEAIQESGMTPSRTGTEMESYFFQKARSRVEYHELVSKRVYYLELDSKKRKNQQMTEDNSWKTESSRQSVVDKLNEAIQQSEKTWSMNGLQMENYYFQEACTKAEYLDYVDTFISSINANLKKKKTAKSRQPLCQQPSAKRTRSN